MVIRGFITGANFIITRANMFGYKLKYLFTSDHVTKGR